MLFARITCNSLRSSSTARSLSISNATTAPLRLSTCFGAVGAIAAVLYLIWVIIEKLFWGIDVPGYATIIVLILFFGSLQLFCIGIIGEYVGRIFEQSKDRPIYIAKEILTYRDESES